MISIGQPYRLGIWKVAHQSIPEFIEAWQSSSDWLARQLPGEGEAILLQDSEDSTRFVSLGYSSHPEKIEEAMSQPEFEELWSRVEALVEEVAPNRMRVAAYLRR